MSSRGVRLPGYGRARPRELGRAELDIHTEESRVIHLGWRASLIVTASLLAVVLNETELVFVVREGNQLSEMFLADLDAQTSFNELDSGFGCADDSLKRKRADGVCNELKPSRDRDTAFCYRGNLSEARRNR